MNQAPSAAEFALQANLSRRVNVGDMLTRSAARTPHKTALVEGPRRLSYRELNEWVNRSAHGLVALGYRPGDALGLMSGNCIEFLVTYYACAKIGVVCTPLNLFWRQGELSYVLGHAQVRGVVAQQRWLGELALVLGDLPGVREVIAIEGPVPADAGLPQRIESLSLQQLGPASLPPSRTFWWTTGRRCPTSIPAAPPRHRRAWSATIWRFILKPWALSLTSK